MGTEKKNILYCLVNTCTSFLVWVITCTTKLEGRYHLLTPPNLDQICSRVESHHHARLFHVDLPNPTRHLLGLYFFFCFVIGVLYQSYYRILSPFQHGFIAQPASTRLKAKVNGCVHVTRRRGVRFEKISIICQISVWQISSPNHSFSCFIVRRRTEVNKRVQRWSQKHNWWAPQVK